MSKSHFQLGVALGLAVGVIGALLLAPQSGQATRQVLKKFKDDNLDLIEKTKQSTDDIIGKTKESIDKMLDKLSDKVEKR